MRACVRTLLISKKYIANLPVKSEIFLKPFENHRVIISTGKIFIVIYIGEGTYAPKSNLTIS